MSVTMFLLPINFEELTMVILDESRSQGLKLSDFVIQNLVVHIALAIKRLESGFQISVIDLDAQRYERKSWSPKTSSIGFGR